ncbi:hypothetical protein OIU84_023068 [Salix udensis]|uniref:Uncharacterized protein n=1 Tax=Salix udensis TaxID=889485 RepID=A0AAD6PF64_9ROSI|nr:hypothetical protein OIU84_023068 [Salix udensis]
MVVKAWTMKIERWGFSEGCWCGYIGAVYRRRSKENERAMTYTLTGQIACFLTKTQKIEGSRNICKRINQRGFRGSHC